MSTIGSVLFWIVAAMVFALGSGCVVAEVRQVLALQALTHDPAAWLGERGVSSWNELDYMKVRGALKGLSSATAPWIIAVVVDDELIVEAHLPSLLRRDRRQHSSRGTDELAYRNGHVVSVDRRFAVRSDPPEKLRDCLAARGWSLAS